jgi:hypothetical protein
LPNEEKQKEFRSWLLLLSSLAATITFTAGLTPPGGFWSADDMANGYVAGTSVMRDKFPLRYLFFYCSNTIAFFTSLGVAGMLARNVRIRSRHFILLTGVCFLSLGTSYITGTWVSLTLGMLTISLFLVVICYMSTHWVKDWLRRRFPVSYGFAYTKLVFLFSQLGIYLSVAQWPDVDTHL